MALPKPPAEVPATADMAVLAPLFRRDVQRLLVRLAEHGHQPLVRETHRSVERWRYLYGFGREYDDGRGVVTKAGAPELTWHFYCLAADIVCAKRGDDATADFRADLGVEAKKLRLVWGGDWKDINPPHGDWPHVQWGAPMRRSPSQLAKQIMDEHGLEALWRTVQAA